MKFKVVCQHCLYEEFEPYKGRYICGQCGEIVEDRDDLEILTVDEE